MTMKGTKWNLVIMATLVMILMACGSPSARASESSLSKKELNTLIANAKTPQDHERLAAYYRSQEHVAEEKQAEHEEMLRRYHENPLSHRFTKTPSPDDHCRALIRIFGDEARQNAALAEYHEKVAKDLSR
jgi:hypothetical protein